MKLEENDGVTYLLPPPPITFGNSWRVKHNTENNTMELQKYESSAWVPKFTFTL